MRKIISHVLLVVAMVASTWAQTQPAPTPTPRATPLPARPGPCGTDYYRNSQGVCVHRPVKTQGTATPAGATAQCRDGSYSFSKSHRGTCSRHGGVAKWL
jgi:uncharacterized protein DUF3761